MVSHFAKFSFVSLLCARIFNPFAFPNISGAGDTGAIVSNAANSGNSGLFGGNSVRNGGKHSNYQFGTQSTIADGKDVQGMFGLK